MQDHKLSECLYNETIGSNVRKARLMAGQTLQDLADAFGLTYQQVQKYEKGHTRISAAKLYLIACHFKLGSVAPLYEGVTDTLAPAAVGLPPIDAAAPHDRLQLELSKLLPDLPRAVVRELLNLARSVVSAGAITEAA